MRLGWSRWVAYCLVAAWAGACISAAQASTPVDGVAPAQAQRSRTAEDCVLELQNMKAEISALASRVSLLRAQYGNTWSVRGLGLKRDALRADINARLARFAIVQDEFDSRRHQQDKAAMAQALGQLLGNRPVPQDTVDVAAASMRNSELAHGFRYWRESTEQVFWGEEAAYESALRIADMQRRAAGAVAGALLLGIPLAIFFLRKQDDFSAALEN